MSGFDGYDQWKTASPYDDEPDVIEECLNVAEELRNFVKTHKELSDLTHVEEFLMLKAADTLDAAKDYINENI